MREALAHELKGSKARVADFDSVVASFSCTFSKLHGDFSLLRLNMRPMTVPHDEGRNLNSHLVKKPRVLLKTTLSAGYEIERRRGEEGGGGVMRSQALGDRRCRVLRETLGWVTCVSAFVFRSHALSDSCVLNFECAARK